MSIHLFKPDQPSPNLWSDRHRGVEESALDCETAVSLACHLNRDFLDATNWTSLIRSLAGHGFRLAYIEDRLVLINDETGVELCTCGFLGHGFATLTERFGKPCVHGVSGRLVAAPDRQSNN